MNLWGKKPERIDFEAIRERSKAEVVRLGGRTLDALPMLEETKPRTGEALIDRTLVLNALIGLAFEAPVGVIREWIETHRLTPALTTDETSLLEWETADLTQQERINLSWSVEALYAFLWAAGLAPALPIGEPPPEDAFDRLPRVGAGEGPEAFIKAVRMRPAAELFAMLDLYYRAHWFARDGQLNGYETGVFELSPILERRKALEWLLDERTDWDDIDLST